MKYKVVVPTKVLKTMMVNPKTVVKEVQVIEEQGNKTTYMFEHNGELITEVCRSKKLFNTYREAIDSISEYLMMGVVASGYGELIKTTMQKEMAKLVEDGESLENISRHQQKLNKLTELLEDDENEDEDEH